MHRIRRTDQRCVWRCTTSNQIGHRGNGCTPLVNRLVCRRNLQYIGSYRDSNNYSLTSCIGNCDVRRPLRQQAHRNRRSGYRSTCNSGVAGTHGIRRNPTVDGNCVRRPRSPSDTSWRRSQSTHLDRDRNIECDSSRISYQQGDGARLRLPRNSHRRTRNRCAGNTSIRTVHRIRSNTSTHIELQGLIGPQRDRGSSATRQWNCFGNYGNFDLLDRQTFVVNRYCRCSITVA